MKVLNFGSLNIDNVYQVDHMVMPGETQASFGMQIFPGGKGLNQSIAMARAGVPVYHAGLIGEEGDLLLDVCRENGVNTDYIRRIPGRSGHTIIQVDKDGQNCILLFGGANRSMTKDFVDEVLAGFEAGDILVLQNEINELACIIDKAAEKGMQIVLNPSPFDSNLDGCDLSKVDIFMMNEVEGWQITGEKDPDRILEKVKELYPGARVVLTLGKDGAVYQDGDQIYRQGIYPVKAVDTTAAGDTFTGYFIYSVIAGLPVQEGLDLAAKASSICVSRPGAASSVPFLHEVRPEKTVV